MEHLISKSSASYVPRRSEDGIDEYIECFKEVIRLREHKRIPFLHTSPQSPYRSNVIKYMRQICIDKKFSHCCLHLAVYILDIFMDCHNVIPPKILLLANVCLLLAAKLEETACSIPKISELNLLTHHRYTMREYKDLEIMVLDYFSWYIMFPTVAHYIHYYFQAAVTYEELLDHSKGYRTTMYQIHDNVLEYLDQIIENVHYMQDFRPSHLAAGIIAASRLECGLYLWSANLESFTNYTEEQLQPVLYTLHINKFTQKVEPTLAYSNYICTFKGNYCLNCRMRSCPKCFFLQRL